MGDVVRLADRRPLPPAPTGRDAVFQIFDGRASWDDIDVFLGKLWLRGFAVLPIDPGGDAA